jgi:hypothetical protein
MEKNFGNTSVVKQATMISTYDEHHCTAVQCCQMQLKFFPLHITKNPSEGLKIPPLPQRIHDKYLKFSEKSLTLDISFHVTSTGNEEKLATLSP